MPFELWKYIPYEADIIAFEQLKPLFAQTTGFPISKIAQAVEKEIKVYTIEDRLAGKNQNIKEIFENLREAILNFSPEIREKVKKHYIAYELTRNFTEFIIQSSAVKVYLDIPIGELQDVAHVAQDCTKVGHWATGDARFKVHSSDEVAYAIGLIKQAYEKNLGKSIAP